MMMNNQIYFKDDQLKSLKFASMMHLLQSERLPLTKVALKEFVFRWKQSNETCFSSPIESTRVSDSLVELMVKDEPWITPLLNVTSSESEPFTVRFQPQASVKVNSTIRGTMLKKNITN
jgi:hypothetical protein